MKAIRLTPEEIEEREAREQFEKWKEQYWNLYYIDIMGHEFLFRELSRQEYRKWLRLYKDDNALLEDSICKQCVLDPADYDYDFCPAGIPVLLASAILEESGFVEDSGKLDEYIEIYRKEMESADNVITCTIKEAFPELGIEEIDSWPMQKAVWYFSRAEYILREFRGLVRTSDPNEVGAEKRSKPVRRPAEEQPKVPPSDRKFEYDLSGSRSDFPELAEIDAFMKGKWNPPPMRGDEELI